MRIALAGDTMLGRGVAERLGEVAPASLFADEVVAIGRSADVFVLNLECCISTGGKRWPQAGKPFFFRAPPAAVEVLTHLGVDCVTLANNHALDFGYDALSDTFSHLSGAGIQWVGAGRDVTEARAIKTLDVGEEPLGILGITDHPDDFAATEERAGVAFVDLRRGVPEWLKSSIQAYGRGPLLVLPHWGPNMNPEPLPYVRAAARDLLEAGAALVAGHSAHVFQGAQNSILYDLGDFIDDYATDPILRNDLGLLWLVDIESGRVFRSEAIPLKLDYCHTRLARGDEWEWIADRLEVACVPLGTTVLRHGRRLLLEPAR